jgi:tetratricopeptide (TPR) repeat protein
MERQRASDYLTGVIYLLGRDFDQAIQYLERAVRQVPEEAAIHNDLGVAYLEKGGRTLEDREQNLERAQAEFELSLSLDESFAPAVYNSALLYERTGRLGRSDNFSRRYLGMDSESDWAIEIRTRLEELR